MGVRSRLLRRISRNGSHSPQGVEKQPGEQSALVCAHPRDRLKPLFATRDYITGDPFMVGYCYDCHLHVTTPAPPQSEIDRYYPKGYYGSGKRFTRIIEWLLDNLYNYRVYQIEQNQKPGKVLDIGCGRGLLLHKLRQRGWTPMGTELNEEAATYAREQLGLPVTTQMVEEAGFPDGEFDLIILWHVLEHVQSPRAMLREVSRILKPGGTLLVAVPNFGSLEARLSGKSWFHLDVPRHLTHFTKATLQHALDTAGLTISSTNFFSTEYDFFSFVQTAQNKLGLRHNLLYNVLRTRSAKVVDAEGNTVGSALMQSLAALLTAIPLALFSLFYAPLVAALGKGATIAAYAKKR
ncbi:MAG: class I SAM-dependent methyltransferase [Chloroflexia bacterium]